MNCVFWLKMSHLDDHISSENSIIYARKDKEGDYMLDAALLSKYFIIFWRWEGSFTDYGQTSDKVEAGIGNKLQMVLDHIKLSVFPILSWLIWLAKRKSESNLKSRLRSKWTDFDFLMKEWTNYKILKLSQTAQFLAWFSHLCVHILFQILFYCRLLQGIDYSSLCYMAGPCCLPFLYMIVCLFGICLNELVCDFISFSTSINQVFSSQAHSRSTR